MWFVISINVSIWDIDTDDKPHVLHVYPTRKQVQEYNHIKQIQWGTEAVEILAEHYLIVQKIHLQGACDFRKEVVRRQLHPSDGGHQGGMERWVVGVS